MAKLIFNYDSLNYSCVQNLNDCISKLDSAMLIFNSISIPYDYNRKQEIKNIRNSISKKRQELVNIRECVINSNRDFSAFINDSTDRINALPKIQFGTRKSI